MRTSVVVIVDELRHDSYQVALVDHNQVIHALDANRPHHPFGDRVGVWGPTRSLDSDDAHGSGPRVEVPAVDRVAIVDQVRRLASPRRGIDQLPPDPCGGGVRGDLKVP
jgi:hypothetical protein